MLLSKLSRSGSRFRLGLGLSFAQSRPPIFGLFQGVRRFNHWQQPAPFQRINESSIQSRMYSTEPSHPFSNTNVPDSSPSTAHPAQPAPTERPSKRARRRRGKALAKAQAQAALETPPRTGLLAEILESVKPPPSSSGSCPKSRSHSHSPSHTQARYQPPPKPQSKPSSTSPASTPTTSPSSSSSSPSSSSPSSSSLLDRSLVDELYRHLPWSRHGRDKVHNGLVAADSTIMRLRHLPYDAQEHQVYQALYPHPVLAVHFVRHSDGRFTGSAFVELPDENAFNAILRQPVYVGGYEIGKSMASRHSVHKEMELLTEPRDPNSIVIRLSNLPPRVTARDIEGFFVGIPVIAVHLPVDLYSSSSRRVQREQLSQMMSSTLSLKLDFDNLSGDDVGSKSGGGGSSSNGDSSSGGHIAGESMSSERSRTGMNINSVSGEEHEQASEALSSLFDSFDEPASGESKHTSEDDSSIDFHSNANFQASSDAEISDVDLESDYHSHSYSDHPESYSNYSASDSYSNFDSHSHSSYSDSESTSNFDSPDSSSSSTSNFDSNLYPPPRPMPQLSNKHAVEPHQITAEPEYAYVELHNEALARFALSSFNGGILKHHEILVEMSSQDELAKALIAMKSLPNTSPVVNEAFINTPCLLMHGFDPFSSRQSLLDFFESAGLTPTRLALIRTRHASEYTSASLTATTDNINTITDTDKHINSETGTGNDNESDKLTTSDPSITDPTARPLHPHSTACVQFASIDEARAAMRLHRERWQNTFIHLRPLELAKMEEMIEREKLLENASFTWIQMFGFHIGTPKEDIINFFSRASVRPTAIYITKDRTLAYLRFANPLHAQQAMSLDQHYLEDRYMALRFVDDLFIKNVIERDSKPVDVSSCTCIIMNGIPYSTRESDVIEFLQRAIPDLPSSFSAARLRLRLRYGNAYVQLRSSDDVSKALSLDRQRLGRRYVEIDPLTQERFEALWEKMDQEKARQARQSRQSGYYRDQSDHDSQDFDEEHNAEPRY